MRREPCTVCGLPVFLAEKLVIARSPYHRTCFRCARCHNQLTPGNYYETESNEFCCETCPDEVYQSAGRSADPATFPKNLDVPLSDEEKSSLGRNASLAQFQDFDRTSIVQRMRLDFMTNHLLADKVEELSVVDGPVKEDTESSEDEEEVDNDDEEETDENNQEEETESSPSLPQDELTVNKSVEVKEEQDNQHSTAISSHDVESKDVEVKDNTKEDRPLSLVQQRLKMFEGQMSPGPRLSTQEVQQVTEDQSPEPSDVLTFSQQEEPLSRLEDQSEQNLIEEYPEDLNPFGEDAEEEDSTNPFVNDNANKSIEFPMPARRSSVLELSTKRKLEAPKISLNPFESDMENSDKEEEAETPVPKPRTMKQAPETNLSQTLGLDRSGIYASNTSITSSGSATTTTPGGSYRKKKPAPQPPTPNKGQHNANQTATSTSSLNLSTSGVTQNITPRGRKTKPAPPPPKLASTSKSVSQIIPAAQDQYSIEDKSPVSKLSSWTDEKLSKDEANRNRQSLTANENPCVPFTDKSVEGKWKRKKGPAPPRPIPHRRKIKVMSIKDLRFELDEIELQQQGLEKQGVRLEQIIRDKCESQVCEDASLGVDVEELVLELFTLVNEKNELFRRQAELMLLRRQYRLEEEHADIEYQIRCLMCQPEATKTDFDKQREEALIQRLVEIVERRNEIVECLEMDRKREVEEDRSIHTHMGLYAAKNKSEIVGNNNEAAKLSKSKKSKLKEKLKERKLKKNQKKDADKDVDEAEAKLKRHAKRKWF